MQMEVIKCYTKVAMEAIGEAWNRKSKIAESRFASSDEIVVDQLKLNPKNKNMTTSYRNVVECLGKMGKWKKIQP